MWWAVLGGCVDAVKYSLCEVCEEGGCRVQGSETMLGWSEADVGVGYVEDEAFNYFGWGAEKGNGAVGGGVCGVFFGFENCDDGAVFPNVRNYVVCITVICNVGE